ncbi:MAG: PcfJ domain-containing protein, partial [Chlorobi bacterium]|nr:PcfJ domain-containing protein [Chlorobiota bacterium]
LDYFEKYINAGLDKDIISCLKSWRKLYSITERVSRALNKTLSNLTDISGSNNMLEFPNYSLVRPLSNRLEIAVSSCGYDSRHSKIIMHAKEDRIIRALSLYSQHIRGVAVDSFLSLISEFVEFLDKFPDIHNGNIVGLTEKAIKWQEEEKDRDVMKLFCKYDETNKTAIPQFKLCENENIQFLSSAVDIVQEGVTMKHCITEFIEAAIEGRSFYYHVNFNEESATAELDKYGRLVQINGPKNKTNTAVDFGSTFFLNSNNFVNPPVKMVCDRWQLSLFA